MEVVKDESDDFFMDFHERLCLCNCEWCATVSPHPVHNCFFKCKNRLKMDEETLKNLGMYTECHCMCAKCSLRKTASNML